MAHYFDIRKKFKLNNIIVADDLRTEINGKILVIGLYDNTCIVPTFPFGFSKLVIRIGFTLFTDAKTFKLLVNSENTGTIVEVQDDLPNHNANEPQSVQIELQGLILEKPDDWTFSMGIDGDLWELYRFNVRLPATDQEASRIKNN